MRPNRIRKNAGVRNCLRVVALLVAISAAASTSRSAQRSVELQVKGALLYNFMKFVEWPSSELPANDGPMTIGVVGDPAMVEALGMLTGKTVKGRALSVHSFNRVAAIEPCQVLFISGQSSDLPREVMKVVGNSSVLTVTELENVGRFDAVINLIVVANRMAFDINLDAAARARLEVSSQLLAIAHAVNGGRGGRRP